MAVEQLKDKMLIRHFVTVEKNSYAIFYARDIKDGEWLGPAVPWGSAKPLLCKMTMHTAWDYMKKIEENWDDIFPNGITNNIPPTPVLPEPKNPGLIVTGFLSYEELGSIGEE